MKRAQFWVLLPLVVLLVSACSGQAAAPAKSPASAPTTASAPAPTTSSASAAPTSVASAAAASPTAVSASATYPDKLVTWIVPAGPGGNVDTVPRAITPILAQNLPGTGGIVLDNISPPVTTKGLATLNQSAPDGFTVADMAPDSASIIQLTEKGVPWDMTKFTYIGTISKSPKLIIRRNDFPYSTLKDMAAAKAKVRFVTIPGTFQLFSALVAKEVGLDASYVTGYKGTGDVILGLIRGDGDLAVVNLPSVASYLKDGKVKVVCTLTEEKLGADLPTAKDSGYQGLVDMSAYASSSIVAFGPPKMPATIVKTLSDGLKKTLDDPSIKAWADKTGTTLAFQTPEETTRSVLAGYDVFSKYVSYLK